MVGDKATELDGGEGCENVPELPTIGRETASVSADFADTGLLAWREAATASTVDVLAAARASKRLAWEAVQAHRLVSVGVTPALAMAAEVARVAAAPMVAAARAAGMAFAARQAMTFVNPAAQVLAAVRASSIPRIDVWDRYRNPFRDTLRHVMEIVAAARAAMDEGFEHACANWRGSQRQQLGAALEASLSAHDRVAYAAVQTRMALRLNVDRSPPPREAIVTTARKVRGPNTADRLRDVVVRLREVPMTLVRVQGSPRFSGDLYAKHQPASAV